MILLLYCPVLPSIVCMHTVQFALALLESQSGTSGKVLYVALYP